MLDFAVLVTVLNVGEPHRLLHVGGSGSTIDRESEGPALMTKTARHISAIPPISHQPQLLPPSRAKVFSCQAICGRAPR
jgi:hypothetical protein